MTRILVPTLVALCALAAGCGGSTDSDGSSTGGSGGSAGGSGSGGSSGGGAGGSGGTCESFVPCCDGQGNPVTPVCPTPGNPQCPAGSSWPPNGTCAPPAGSCSPSKPCAADEYCDYGDDLCGAGSPGKCTKRPQGCDLMYAPVCTCEGKVAGNECSGQSGGWDVSAKGGCTPPQDLFACGHLFCMAQQQYCQIQLSDVGGYPDTFACKVLPAACGSVPSCGCVASEPCGGMCKADAAGNPTVSCPGG